LDRREGGGWPQPRITIRAAALREIAAHARDAWPDECCGLLIGTTAAIEAVYRARNADESRTRYLVCPEDHFAAIRLARAQGVDVVGAYHSHPTGRPQPSAADRDEAHGGGFTYVIAGTRRLRRARWQRPRRPNGGGRPWRRQPASHRLPSRVVQSNGQWLAAWRLAEGNFVQLPLVRLA
jgi:desampylase